MSLPVIEGFDWNKALEFLGDEDFVVEMATEFRADIDGYIDILNEAMNNATNDEVVANYAIKSHAVKSSLKMFGAMELSEYALACEMAGKEKNAAAILSETPKLIEKLNWVKEQFQVF